ncbi:N-acetyltransferase GCN5 [Actinoplanes sp. SE50]|uniref:GNAT family N-acetyltransferase n=1 Tax=unclassified Actinoplanes TaxID=2626549 RepID=UPI00023ED696|nr:MULTISPECIES: GNAT family N-acetyltransferase [unclassified Actinoplanes]AEV86811.1 GCN5-related N-acetyltransferase [Actinoplanes sp. SE50/110]ATO85208.1 N-acetyltransferase GCN5 [Actinoplanes sp. SE50]SLM02618.1 N-acetyltransferase GCN5 [Actinoplanes sp. SE50/110]
MTDVPPLRIRVYQPADLLVVHELNRAGLAAAGVPADADVYAGDLDDPAATYLRGRAILLVGEADGRVVAMGALQEVDRDSCEITRMRVAAPVQGRGYGRSMLHALEDHAVRLGYRRAVLLTGPDQHPAIDLYRSAGYTVTSWEQHGLIPGIRMTKSLP